MQFWMGGDRVALPDLHTEHEDVRNLWLQWNDQFEKVLHDMMVC